MAFAYVASPLIFFFADPKISPVFVTVFLINREVPLIIFTPESRIRKIASDGSLVIAATVEFHIKSPRLELLSKTFT